MSCSAPKNESKEKLTIMLRTSTHKKSPILSITSQNQLCEVAMSMAVSPCKGKNGLSHTLQQNCDIPSARSREISPHSHEGAVILQISEPQQIHKNSLSRACACVSGKPWL